LATEDSDLYDSGTLSIANIRLVKVLEAMKVANADMSNVK